MMDGETADAEAFLSQVVLSIPCKAGDDDHMHCTGGDGDEEKL